jgi:hypothetical protein
MELSKKSIKEFQEIYHNDYGVVLSDEEAQEKASLFFRLMQNVYRPIGK